jgi:hypothetical protein
MAANRRFILAHRFRLLPIRESSINLRVGGNNARCVLSNSTLRKPLLCRLKKVSHVHKRGENASRKVEKTSGTMTVCMCGSNAQMPRKSNKIPGNN